MTPRQRQTRWCPVACWLLAVLNLSLGDTAFGVASICTAVASSILWVGAR
jgi:hypothetical protein